MSKDLIVPEELFAEDDGVVTETSVKQQATERDVARFYKHYKAMDESQKWKLRKHHVVDSKSLEFRLYREKTVSYLLSKSGLVEGGLSSSYTSLASSRPWLLYWTLHALQLLDAFTVKGSRELDPKMCQRVMKTLRDCHNDRTGARKPSLQVAIPWLCRVSPHCRHIMLQRSVGHHIIIKAYEVVDRKALYRWLLSLKDEETKAFRVQHDGEIDTRGLYTVLAVASICNMLTPELVEGTAEYIGSCQTFEGGIGGEPGNEAHGGYAFCGLAALHILQRFDTVDFTAFARWISARQMRFEGGFQGRTNKLVDSCYSFWQGAIPVLLKMLPVESCNGRPLFLHRSSREDVETVKAEKWTGQSLSFGQDDLYETYGECLFDQIRLQQYILLCCQFAEGGLRDKPSKSRDQYHTCYSLSGMSLSQHHGAVEPETGASLPLVWGDSSNLLRQTDPVYNVDVELLEKAMSYFKAKPSTHAYLTS